MRSWISFGAVVGLMCLGCGQAPGALRSTSSGSLALSRDEKTLYAVDTDNGILAAIDLASSQKVAQVQVGLAPERVIVGPDDTIYVSNRGERSVSVILPGSWSEKARLSVGVEPVGLATSNDGKTLYVVNATALDTPTQGSVMAFDTATLQMKWESKVGAEPRGITLIDSHTAVVGLYREGGLDFVNLDDPTQVAAAAPPAGVTAGQSFYGTLNATKFGNDTSTKGFATAFSSFHPRSVADVVALPDGSRVFATTMLAREDALDNAPTISDYNYANGGPCSVGAVATPGLLTWDVSKKAALADDVTACNQVGLSSTADFPPTLLASPTGAPITGVHVAAVDPTGSFIFLVNRESNNVAVLPTATRDNAANAGSFQNTGTTVRALVAVGAAPNGIALTSDGKRAYVYNSFDHTVSTLVQGSQGTVVELTDASALPARITVAQDPANVSADVLKGRRMFFDATDGRMNSQKIGVTCNSCHTEGGRDDGHTWAFPDGPRNTPSLAGRAMLQTAPYHWSGDFTDLNAFLDHTISVRMGGSGLSDAEHAQIAAYIGSLQAPDNPMHVTQLTAEQVRGAKVFIASGCNTCHTGASLTNNAFADVGTILPNDTLPRGLNIPSLLSLARTGPYLHDGSAPTLQARIDMNRLSSDPRVQISHGNLAGVSDSQAADLVAFLQSL